MEIHELNTFSGTPGAGDYLATDNGNDTSKISIKSITDPLNARIDNIIAGPASSAQEVIDARRGVNGTVYASLGEAIRAQASDSDAAINAIVKENEFDVLAQLSPANGTDGGVTYTKNGDKYTVQGTTGASSGSHHNIYTGPLPLGLVVGETYHVKYHSPSQKVQLAIYCYTANLASRIQAWWLTDDATITIPTGTAEVIIWLLIQSTSTTVDEIVEPHIFSSNPSLQLRDASKYTKTDSTGDYVDYDDFTKTGLYLCGTSWRKLNAPTDGSFNAIEVYEFAFGTNDIVKQVTYNITTGVSETIVSSAYERYRNFNGWTEWIKKPDGWTEELIFYSLTHYNSYDYLYKYMSIALTPYTSNGITYSINDGKFTVSGTASNFSNYELYRGPLPDGIAAGDILHGVCNSVSGMVDLSVYFYDADWNSETRTAYFITGEQDIAVPNNAVNALVWITVRTTGIAVNETIRPALLTRAAGRGGSGETIINNNEFNYTVNKNSYVVQASPKIQPVSDYYLAPSGDMSDRTNDIITLLQTQKVCRLGAGDYYIKTGIDMPDGTSLIGCGRATRLILDASVTEGYVISVGSYCSVQDMFITGSPNSNLPYEEYEIGGRDGIVQLGDYVDFETPATFSANFDKLSNLWIENFNGSGIRSYRNDGAASFLAENIDILRCGIGINIELFSEFHSWENIRCRWCVYACIMNGGNNLFSNCHWDTCIHLLKIDNSLGNLVNDTHSSFVNCTFCHANNNQGNAIEAIGVQNGLVFSNCQIFYSKIILTDTKGVVMTNFNFGGGENIILTRCRGINISNCIFGSAPVITRTDVTGLIYENNMTRNGSPLTLS